MASPINERRLKDALLSANVALPNAANTTCTNSLDLQAATPFPTTEKFQVLIETSTANGSNSKNINCRLQHSDDANVANFVNIAELGNPLLRVTDASNAGFPAANLRTALPPTAKRYLRAVATGEANGGDAGGGTLTVTLLF